VRDEVLKHPFFDRVSRGDKSNTSSVSSANQHEMTMDSGHYTLNSTSNCSRQSVNSTTTSNHLLPCNRRHTSRSAGGGVGAPVTYSSSSSSRPSSTSTRLASTSSRVRAFLDMLQERETSNHSSRFSSLSIGESMLSAQSTRFNHNHTSGGNDITDRFVAAHHSGVVRSSEGIHSVTATTSYLRAHQSV